MTQKSEFNNDSKFDIDLRYGQKVECKVREALEGTIEVKAERDLWRITGNVAVEFRSRGKPSGIAVTEAKHWCHVLMDGEDVALYILKDTESMKELARYYYRNGSVVRGGDDDTSEIVLIPINSLVGDKDYEIN